MKEHENTVVYEYSTAKHLQYSATVVVVVVCVCVCLCGGGGSGGGGLHVTRTWLERDGLSI